MNTHHVLGIVIETDTPIILKLNELQRNSNLVLKNTQIDRKTSESQLSISIHRLILSERLPSSAILQQALCDSLTSLKVSLNTHEVENLRNRTAACCRKTIPVINQPDIFNTLRDPLRVSTGRLLQHENYIKPDVYQCIGTIRFYRLDKLDTEDKHIMLPFVPSAFMPSDLVHTLIPFCTKRTVVFMFADDIKHPEFYHAIFTFKNIKEASHFVQCLSGQLISSVGDDGNESVRFKLAPIAIRFMHATPSVDRINASGALEIPTCPGCLASLDETVINWHHIPGALEGHVDHSIGCPARIAATYAYTHCSACEESEDLWLCVICGNVACSRYKRSHGINHCSCTGHSLTVKLSTFNSTSPFVWNYATDSCVQRLGSINTTEEKSADKQIETTEQGQHITSYENSSSLAKNPVDEEPRSNLSEEKKAITILELNALYTSAIDHTDHVNEVILKDLEETYKNAEQTMKVEMDEIKRRWDKNIGGEQGAANKLARRREYLKKQEKNLEEEQELNLCLLSNLEEKKRLLKQKHKELNEIQKTLKDLENESTQMMARMGLH